MISTARKEIFKDLRVQIEDKTVWRKDQFLIYNFEACLGKSLYAQELLAKSSERALYVQRFSKDGALEDTAVRINRLAGEDIAVAVTGENIAKAGMELKITEAKVLCITTKMYSRICRGFHLFMLNNRSILVIDEYPEIMEKITVGNNEIGQLFTNIYRYGYTETDELAYLLRELSYKYSNDVEILKNREMTFVDFNDHKYTKFKRLLEDLYNKVKRMGNVTHSDLLFKFQQLLKNGAYFYQGVFHTFDSTVGFALLDCNIILDANGFDYRYSLSSKFQVVNQAKYLDYSQAELHHYEANTNKKNIEKYINLTEKVLENITMKNSKGVLYITQKDQIKNVEAGIEQYFNGSLPDIIKQMGVPHSIDYFGNLIGKNDYRLMDTVIVLKTPHFNYETYVIDKFFYNSIEGLPSHSFSVFQDKDVEAIRLSSIAGEIYQAVRRVARDNPNTAKIYIVNDNQDVMNMVREQIPNIQYFKHQIHLSKSADDKKQKVKSLKNIRVKIAKEIIIKSKESGAPFINKRDVRVKLGIKSSPNFSQILRELETFLEVNKIKSIGQKLVFT